MSDSTKPSSTTADAPTSATSQELRSDSKLKITRARSDISSDAEDDNGPSSPHFYSLSVRKSSPSLETYPADSVNTPADSLAEFNIDDSIKEDLASEQQVHEQAVKLDLLRRQHSQRARQTLEQLQTAASTAASTASQRSDSPGRPPSEPKRSNSGVAMELVRQQSEQLKQASGDLKRLAEEQRTLAEEAVANFLLKVLHSMPIHLVHSVIASWSLLFHAQVPAMLFQLQFTQCLNDKIFEQQNSQCVCCIQEDMMMSEGNADSAGTSSADVSHLHALIMTLQAMSSAPGSAVGQTQTWFLASPYVHGKSHGKAMPCSAATEKCFHPLILGSLNAVTDAFGTMLVS